MTKGVIVQRFPEQSVPKDFFKLAIESNKTAYGYSILHNGELNCSQIAGEGDEEKFFTLQDKFKGPALFCFVNYPAGYPQDDLQPFEILFDKDNKLLVSGFVVGEFTNYAQTDSNHNTAHYLVEKFLRPKLKQFYRLCGENIEKVYAEFNTDDMRSEFANQFVGDGCIMLHFVNGGILNYHSKDDKAHEFPWGWTSNSYGYEASGQPKTKGLGLGLKGGLDILGMLTGGKKEAQSDLSSAKTGHEEKAEEGLGISLAVVAGDKAPVLGDFLKTKELNFPPTDKLKKVGHVKNWYRDKGGSIASIPDNIDELFKDFKAGKLKQLPGIISARDRKEAQIEYERAVAAYKAKTPIDKAVETKSSGLGMSTAVLKSSTASPIKEATVVEKSQKQIVENLPIVVPEDKKWLVEEFMSKYIDKEGEFIPLDPRKIQGLESKWPAVWQVAGIESVDGIKHWSLECFQMLEKRPQLLSLLAFNLKNEIVLLTETTTKVPDTTGLGMEGLLKAKAM